MEKISHEFFGELNLVNGLKDEFDVSDNLIVLWEKDINEINTTLWYDTQATMTTEILDGFAQFLNDFSNYNEKARKELEKYLSKDNEYIVFHREEIECDLPEDVKQFVQCMKVINIGLWIGEENTIIVDYMIVPEETDQLLAVRFNSQLEFMDIAWES